jgi:hypothetical protein
LYLVGPSNFELKFYGSKREVTVTTKEGLLNDKEDEKASS